MMPIVLFSHFEMLAGPNSYAMSNTFSKHNFFNGVKKFNNGMCKYIDVHLSRYIHALYSLLSIITGAGGLRVSYCVKLYKAQ